jgi:predicted ATP-dependent protease
MFFRRNQQGKQQVGAAAPETERVPAAPTGSPLPADALRQSVDPASLGFETTAELKPIEGLLGQDRALKAIQFGADMNAQDYNIFVIGPPATGKLTAVKSHLAQKAKDMPPAADWVYVTNFEEANEPRALQLPHGRGRAFAKGMIAAIDELRNVLPAMFESDDYQTRRRAIDARFRAGHEQAVEALSRKAETQGVAVLRSPTGFVLAPMVDGKVVEPESLETLPPAMRKDVEAKIVTLQGELGVILEQMPKLQKQHRATIGELNEDIARIAVSAALDDIAAAFSDVPAAIEHIKAAGHDMIRNVALFAGTGSPEEGQIAKSPADTSRDERFRRYMVNVVSAKGGAPVIEELNPTFPNLVGRVELVAHMGNLVTDFMLIKPGALHRANGGFLLLDARKMLQSPFAWDALKRALKRREIRIEPPEETRGPIAAQMLDPDPIPLQVKVVMFGNAELFYLLAGADPDFGGLFKVQADFDDTIPRTTENYRAYAQLIAAIVGHRNLLPADSTGVARVIEEAIRISDDREKLSTEVGHISDVLREADYWARKAGHKAIGRGDVARAIDEQIQRADKIRDHAQESIGRGIILVDTDGAKVGQVNGLAVLQLGNFAFGRPNRITARVRTGSGRVVDIEREANLAGPLHTKGVMILWGLRRPLYSNSLMAVSTATAPRPPSFMRCSPPWPKRRFTRALPSRVPSTNGARCRRSAASTRRSKVSSTSARRAA